MSELSPLPVTANATTHPASARGPVPGVSSAPQTRRSPGRRVDAVAIWAALLLIAALYLGCIGVPRLFDQIDGQYAGAAREMVARGDLLVPTQDGVPRLQKPPLFYWLEIASFKAFGINEFAARLPLALSVLGWFAMTGLFAWRITGRALAGPVAALVLATFAGTFFFTHLVMPEPVLALMMSLTIWALWSAEITGSPRRRSVWLTAAWLFMACGSLAKGLHALLFPAFAYAMVAWVVPRRRLACKRFLAFWPGWILFLALVLPWYVMVEARYPGFLKEHFWNEQFGHVFNRRWPPDTDRVPLAVFWVEHLGLLFPWTAFLPLVMPRFVAMCRNWRDQAAKPAGFLGAWFIINAVTILFSSIQDYYLLVSWPALAVGVATVFSGWEGRRRRQAAWSGVALIASGTAALAGAFLARQAIDGNPAGEARAEIHLIDALGCMAGHGGLFLTLLVTVAAALLAAGTAVLVCARFQRPVLAAAAVGLSAATFLVCGAVALPRTEDLFSSWRIADFLNHANPADAQIASESECNDYTSLFFYLPHRVCWVNANPAIEFATRVHGIGKDLYLTEDQLAHAWKQPSRVFLITVKQNLPKWQDRLAGSGSGAYVVLECGARVVLTNQLQSQYRR
ncbi:MAG: phospholipid carrier-dependent glycosyltransferase [Verrucomicrobia bacterium]|nr:phospholipid carrier-dependent glycosyltransferase [Verrucomicrobiota bacterium]